MSSQLEREVLGALILKPELLDKVELKANDFPTDRERQVFQVISDLWKTDRLSEIPLAILVEKMHGNGSASFIAGLIDGNLRPEPAAFAVSVRELRDKHSSAEILRASTALAEGHLKTGAFDEDGFSRLIALIEQRQESRGAVNIQDFLMPGTALQTLQLKTAWSVEKLAPCRSITLLHSPGGLGKTWFSLAMANAVSQGLPFLGLKTEKRPVCYIDFENPLPLLIERSRKLDIRDVCFWHLSASLPPPKLDTAAHLLYRQLPAGSLIIFDTLRAAHDGDENSSQDMALVMGRLKELRERGFDIFLIHHTGKANERQYKGSTAISDLADHVLKLYRSRKGSLEEIQDDIDTDPDATFVLATGKTRFEPFHLFLSFDPDAGGFSVAEDPDRAALDTLADYIAGPGLGRNQTEIIEWAKTSLGGGRKQNFSNLLHRGEREGLWHSRRGFKGARLYEPKS